jgi:hypothetical protein
LKVIRRRLVYMLLLPVLAQVCLRSPNEGQRE